MDWKDKIKDAATDAAQSKAVNSVAKEHGNAAADIANDSLDAAKNNNAKQFAQKQKLAAQQRAREVAERKYSEGKASAANKVTEQYGNTAGQAASDGIDAERNGDIQGFEQQQKNAAKGRAKDTAERKIEEQLAGHTAAQNSAAKAGQAAAMSADEKRELLKDMDISYASKQVQTQEEVLAGTQAGGMSVDQKRELLKDMDISHTSKQTQTQEQVLAEENTPPAAQTSSSTVPPQAAEKSKPQKAPIAISALNTLVIDNPANNIVLQDHKGEPLGNTKYLIEAKNRKIEGVTDAAGLVEIKLPEGMGEIFITFWPDPADETETLTIALALGKLKPATDDEGIQQRLANLGVLQGNIDGDIGPLTQQSIKALQFSQQLTLSGTIDGETQSWLKDNEGIA